MAVAMDRGNAEKPGDRIHLANGANYLHIPAMVVMGVMETMEVLVLRVQWDMETKL